MNVKEARASLAGMANSTTVEAVLTVLRDLERSALESMLVSTGEEMYEAKGAVLGLRRAIKELTIAPEREVTEKPPVYDGGHY